ncbi:putative methionine permease [Aspergillus clavatus NRRL 1]|uniref:Methionine permease, putative n=1 Tax=Aspergillus clavatus (strain ATCC 1007 / CBS 513.65 / DSM 816 / NCTC 3887 / NRRL 1 / QM 1276 / 107) TaxID=344612 RepID=A1CLI4_ASPCL|nr:methionine permease, putative [Aspergillus clavatus NRRL 1]EAW10008.1 methionine permease, putative [Aspergillus clavatus NRRL 1]
MNDTDSQPLLDSRTGPDEALFYESIPQIRQNGRPISTRDTVPETATYGRNLNWSSAYILVISRVIGSGIFATPGSIVKSVGSVGLSLLVWLVGTILAACGLAVSMEFGCMFPRSGGDKVYLEYTYPRPRFLASTLIAVQAVLLGFTASNCIIFAKYTLFALSIDPTEYQHKALAVGLLTAITIVHGCFLKSGIWIQNMLGWVKIFMIGAMALTGLWVILFRSNDYEYSNLASTAGSRIGYEVFEWDNLWEGSNWSWSLLSTSLFKVFYSYAGLNNVNNVLNEVQDPIRTIKSVCPSGLLTACGLYLLANISYFLVVPIDEIKNSGELVGALLFERVFGAHVGRTLFPLAIAISAAGNVMVVCFAWGRINQEIARQGFLPFSSVLSSSRPFNSPLGGLIVHYVPSLLVIALPPQNDVYNFILDVEGYPGQIFALAIAIGLLLLRRRQPNLPRPFKAWLPAVWLRIVVCVALLAAPFIPPPDQKGDVDFFYATYAIVGVGVLLFGVVYWYIWTVLLPRWGKYTLEEEVDVLDDGTSITKLVRSYIF